MAKIVDSIPALGRKSGRDEKYAFDVWFDGRVWLLEQGIDYSADIAPNSMRTTILNALKRRNMAGNVAVRDKKDLYVQAVRRPAEADDPNGETAVTLAQRLAAVAIAQNA